MIFQNMIQCFTCASEIRSIVVDFISFFYLIFDYCLWKSTFGVLLFRFCLFVKLAWCWKKDRCLLCEIRAGSQSKKRYTSIVSLSSIFYWIVYQINRHNKIETRGSYWAHGERTLQKNKTKKRKEIVLPSSQSFVVRRQRKRKRSRKK